MTTSTQPSNPLLTTVILTLVASLVSAQNPPCYLCGGDQNAVFLLPETVLDATTGTTCGELFDFAIQGVVPVADCAEASASTELGLLCGCSNLDGVTEPPDTTPAPVTAPVAAPVVPPIAIPVAVDVPTPPVDVPIAPVASAPEGKKGKKDKKGKKGKKDKKGKKGMMTGTN